MTVEYINDVGFEDSRVVGKHYKVIVAKNNSYLIVTKTTQRWVGQVNFKQVFPL